MDKEQLIRDLKVLSLYELAPLAEQRAWNKTLERLLDVVRTEGTLDAFEMIDSEVAERE